MPGQMANCPWNMGFELGRRARESGTAADLLIGGRSVV
jgi:hypothetical protein